MSRTNASCCASLNLPSAAAEMTQAWQAFEQFASRHLRRQGLTPPQFSVLSALAAAPALSCKCLGERAAISKGSLTGIIDRLEQNGLVRRAASSQDRRSSLVELTEEGRSTFERVAGKHFAHLQQAFDGIDREDLARIEAGLRRLRQLFQPSATSI